MKTTQAFVRLIGLGLVMLVISCSQVPYPVTYQFMQQEKMQAARHWDLLAKDVANQVNNVMRSKKSLLKKSIFIKVTDSTPFGVFFQTLLTTHLYNYDLNISSTEKDSIILEYNAKVLLHGPRKIQHPPILYSILGLGVSVARNIDSDDTWALALPVGLVADGIRGATAGKAPNKEVLISSSLSLDDKLLMHRSNIYYINQPDGWHYDSKPFEQKHAGRVFQVVTQ